MMIKELIEKYFAAETTLEEEAQLRDYFNSVNVDADLQGYQPLFQTLEQESRKEVSTDFDRKLLERMQPGARVVRMRVWQRHLMRVAAVGILLAGAFLLLQPPAPRQQAINWEKYETTDPDLAYEQTKEALRLLASKLNKGSKKTIEEVSKTEKVSKYFN
jgi:hypothetical protein